MIEPKTFPQHAVAIGVITFRRLKGLSKLLESLSRQIPPDGYNIRIIVVNNDPEKQIEVLKVISDTQIYCPFRIDFFLEPEQGISQARNKLISVTENDEALIFVDDDEHVSENWLNSMLITWKRTGADIITAPVIADLPEYAPRWAVQSRIYSDHREYVTGTCIDKAYTNNTLVSALVLKTLRPAFDPKFSMTGSEDIHYFRRAVSAGFKIVWCAEAVVYETIPMSRLSFWWLTKRSFRNGAGDAIVRLSLDNRMRNYLYVFYIGSRRFVYAGYLLIKSILKKDLHYALRAYRLFISGIGAYAGIFGLNYSEYKYVHGE